VENVVVQVVFVDITQQLCAFALGKGKKKNFMVVKRWLNTSCVQGEKVGTG